MTLEDKSLDNTILKVLDIHMESSVYKFMWNLRNKQSGLYPSHIMCDYKKK